LIFLRFHSSLIVFRCVLVMSFLVQKLVRCGRAILLANLRSGCLKLAIASTIPVQ